MSLTTSVPLSTPAPADPFILVPTGEFVPFSLSDVAGIFVNLVGWACVIVIGFRIRNRPWTSTPFGTGLRWTRFKIGVLCVATCSMFVQGTLWVVLHGAEGENKNSGVPGISMSMGFGAAGFGCFLLPAWVLMRKPQWKRLPIDSDLRLTSITFGCMAGLVTWAMARPSVAMLVFTIQALSAFVFCLLIDVRQLWHQQIFLAESGASRPRLLIGTYLFMILFSVGFFVAFPWFDAPLILVFVPAAALAYFVNEIRIYLASAQSAILRTEGDTEVSAIDIPSTVGISAYLPLYFGTMTIMFATSFAAVQTTETGRNHSRIAHGVLLLCGLVVQYSVSDRRGHNRLVKEWEEAKELSLLPSSRTDKGASSSSSCCACCGLSRSLIPLPIRQRATKLIAFVQSWTGQQLLMFGNFGVSSVYFLVNLAAGQYKNPDQAAANVCSEIATALSVTGAVVAGLTLLSRWKPKLKFTPTDDSMRISCLLKGFLSSVKAVIVLLISEKDTWESYIVSALYVLSVVVLGVVTLADAAELIRDSAILGVPRPRLMAICYVLGYVWVQLSSIYIFVCMELSQGSLGRGKTIISIDTLTSIAILGFLLLNLLVTYANNEIVRFFNCRRRLLVPTDASNSQTTPAAAMMTRPALGESVSPLGVVTINVFLSAISLVALIAYVVVATVDSLVRSADLEQRVTAWLGLAFSLLICVRSLFLQQSMSLKTEHLHVGLRVPLLG